MRLKNIIKWTSITLLSLIVLGLLFRGVLYRNLVLYKSIGERNNYVATDDKLVDYIDASIDNQTPLEIEQIIQLGLSMTSDHLQFTKDKNDIDPNKLISSKTSHCVGYASFFATICNYLIDKYNLSNTWVAQPHIGQLFFLGINIHPYFDTPFFKDHDFVVIENKITGKTFAVDPSVYDYLLIDLVSFTK